MLIGIPLNKTTMVSKESLIPLQLDYIRAHRCWRSNQLDSCLQICNSLKQRLPERQDGDKTKQDLPYLSQLKLLFWFLNIRCLGDDYYLNESLLLNENDIENGGKVQTFTSDNRTRTSAGIKTSETIGGRKSRRPTTSGIRLDTRQRAAVITGRVPSVSSRRSGMSTSSYRPLTTNLTATQTAFSRSTRPLLKYSNNPFLSKTFFDYLYSTQTVTNKCPNFRQCLEFLNSAKKLLDPRNTKEKQDDDSLLVSIEDDAKKIRHIGTYWLISFGKCYFNLNMCKYAEEFFESAISMSPKYLDPYTWLVKVYLKTNQPAKVLKTCEEGLRMIKSPILYDWLARVQSLLANNYASNRTLRKSLQLYPTNIEALANVAYFSFYINRTEQSLKCYERIYRLSASNSTIVGSELNNSAGLLNNLALCNFYNGYYHKVIPLFLRAFLSSPDRETTSDLWYNLSFIPMNCGFTNLANACLKLALKNNSQNEEAMNNFGVLKYRAIIDDSVHFPNRHEHWFKENQKQNLDDEIQGGSRSVQLADAEAYFCPQDRSINEEDQYFGQPEMLYNMVMVKRHKGQLLDAIKYSRLYLEYDPGDSHIRSLISDIRQLVSHDC